MISYIDVRRKYLKEGYFSHFLCMITNLIILSFTYCILFTLTPLIKVHDYTEQRMLNTTNIGLFHATVEISTMAWKHKHSCVKYNVSVNRIVHKEMLSQCTDVCVGNSMFACIK